jgi:hypothetical protein
VLASHASRTTIDAEAGVLRCQYAIICEIAREGLKNKLDLLGVFDRIDTPRVPAQHQQIALVILLVADSEDDLGKKPMRLTCVRPNGTLLFEQQGEVEIKPAAGTWLGSTRIMVGMNGLVLPDFGKYAFRLEVAGKEVVTHPLTVVKPDQA